MLGWSGGGLIFLGTGQKRRWPPSQSQVKFCAGDQFTLTGNLSAIGSFPEMILMDKTPTKKLPVRAPEGLTSTSSIDVCIEHAGVIGIFFL